MAQVIPIELPLWQIGLMVLAPPAAAAAGAAGLRRAVRRRTASGEDPDWSVPPLAEAAGSSPFHRWDVRSKIAALLCHCFLVASLRHPAPALAAVGVSLAALAIARASWTRVAMRLLAISGFVGMFLVVMPFTVPDRAGDTVVVINGVDLLGINLRGLVLAATIAAKALAIALLMEPLLSTAPLPVTLHGLSRLGAPEVVGQMVLLSHRYVNVFRQEARRMASGMGVRGFRKRTDMETLRAVANFLGMLFVRSFERTERVFDAMRARGYRGRFPAPARLRLRAGDLVLAAVWVGVGVALLIWDRTAG